MTTIGARTHPRHDAVAAEVRSWFTESWPDIGIDGVDGWFGFVATPSGPDGSRLVLTVDDPTAVPRALADAASTVGAETGLDVWVDDRTRAERLDGALVGAGCGRGVDTTYLALAGALAAAPGPPDLVVEPVDDAGLDQWATVKLQGFGDTEDPPDPAAVTMEVDRRRADLPLARHELAWLGGDPVAVLGWLGGDDRLVFNLATRVPFRHRGIAQSLLRQWVDRGVADGCRSLLINADDGGRPAALYRRMGFTDEVYWRRRYRFPLPAR